ncbi:hypothetical protein A9Q02_21015 [Candidatus Chloroploca asiatica]|uniref:Uncharacterized protein n=1 Tax=Candidatus Chloroploca asiatica TaxID=1506545 RepID=A0A2H3KRU6_9CHLR|nr:hypothetical protein A9Q02_21015 [Candidatus Chloroploca asiatica]
MDIIRWRSFVAKEGQTLFVVLQIIRPNTQMIFVSSSLMLKQKPLREYVFGMLLLVEHRTVGNVLIGQQKDTYI